MWQKILENYEISDSGEIRNANSGRVIRQFVGKDGYLRTQIAGKTRLVHRLVALTYVPRDVGKPFVNHKDGNKRNNQAENLEWCTRSENMRHAYALNLKSSKGIKNSRNKLSEDAVAFIREHYIPKDKEYGAKALARRFGVARQTICAVASGQNWNCSKRAETLPYFKDICIQEDK